MPRERSKSRTPKKEKQEKKDEETTSPKRRRTKSLSGENVESSSPTRMSARQRRVSSASASDVIDAEVVATPAAKAMQKLVKTKPSTSKATTIEKTPKDSPDSGKEVIQSSKSKLFQDSMELDSPVATKSSKKKITPKNVKVSTKGHTNSSKKSERAPKTKANDLSSISKDPMEVDSHPRVKSSRKTKDTNEPKSMDENRLADSIPNDVENQISTKKIKKYPPTIDVNVHRVRHLDYIPSPVLGMASSGSYFALSRQDGSVELYDTTSIPEYSQGKKFTPHLFPLATIAGSKRAVAHSLAWVNKVLVAASPDGTLWSIPFAGRTRQVESRIASGGGGVFDLATCVSLPLVAGACQDGSVRIWQVLEGQLQEPPVATLSTAGSPLLSVAWRCVQQLGDHTYKTEVYIGVADGTIRKYFLDLKVNGAAPVEVQRNIADLRMTVESRGRRTPTKVWTMQALADGSLATGNSLGQIQLWDTVTGTLLHSIHQSDLGADVLKLVINSSGTKLFASGVDSRVVCLERATSTDAAWKFTTAQRPHTHDVKCIALVQANGGTNGESLETLVTAGVDTKLCGYVVSEFAKRRPQVYYPWPSQSPVSSASSDQGQRVLAMHRYNQIELYRLDKQDQLKHSSKSASEQIGEIAVETHSNLSISSISPNGKWLAAANATQLYLFRLKMTSSDKDDLDLEPERVSLPKSLDRNTVVAIHFCNETLFVADSTHRVHVVDLSDKVSIVSTLTLPTTGELPICSLRTSPGGSFLVSMSKSSLDGVHVFQRNDDGTYSPYWTIPGLAGSRPAAIALLGEEQLAVASVSFQVYVFNLEERKLSPWSEANKFPIEQWPLEISHRRDFPVRLFANPKNESQLIMASFGAFVIMNLDAPLPKHCRVVPETHVRSRRKRTRDEEALTAAAKKTNPIIFAPPQERNQGRPQFHNDPNMRNCTVCLNYNSMLHLDFIGEDEMVVVEQPWLRVIARFPEALQRRVYGCN